MSKKIFRTLICTVLICTMLIIPAFAESAVVTGNAVNMRSGPGVGYDVIDCLPKGATVEIIDRSDSSWYAISYNGQRGYMSSRYLSVNSSGSAGTVIQDSQGGSEGYINAMYVRFRSGPSTSNSVIGIYNMGKAVTIYGLENGWTKCAINGEMGFVYSSYVSTGVAPSAGGNNIYIEDGGESSPSTSGAGDPSSGEDSFIIVGNDGREIIIGGNSSSATPAPSASPTPTATPAPSASPAPSVPPSPSGSGIADNDGNSSGVTMTEANAYISGDYVRFRSGPSTTYSIIATYNKGKPLNAQGEENGWTRCVIDGKTGYVFSQYVTLNSAPSSGGATQGENSQTNNPVEGNGGGAVINPVQAPVIPVNSKQGYINGNNVRFRSGPNTNSQVLGEFFFGNVVTITGISGSWTAVNYDGQNGYVFSQYVTEGKYEYISAGTSPSVGGGSATGAEIAAFALQYVGYNYCWGGCSPETGFDCSGLVYYSYGQFGYTLNRVAQDQSMNGVAVPIDQLQPGDILCFYSGGGYIGHSGIYIGDNKFVHAANSATGVIVSDLSGYYAERGFEARRIV